MDFELPSLKKSITINAIILAMVAIFTLNFLLSLYVSAPVIFPTPESKPKISIYIEFVQNPNPGEQWPIGITIENTGGVPATQVILNLQEDPVVTKAQAILEEIAVNDTIKVYLNSSIKAGVDSGLYSTGIDIYLEGEKLDEQKLTFTVGR